MFSELGADYTTVATVAEDLSLLESCNEFQEAFKNGNTPILAGMCPGLRNAKNLIEVFISLNASM